MGKTYIIPIFIDLHHRVSGRCMAVNVTYLERVTSEERGCSLYFHGNPNPVPVMEPEAAVFSQIARYIQS